jgi:glucose-1-phosphate adenylyltransferase
VWRTEELVRRVADDATRDTNHDFGKDLIPEMVAEGCRVWAYDFSEAPGGGKGYWRDIGTLDAYWQANMELVDVVPDLNLYDREWPIYGYKGQSPPAKTVHGDLSSVTDSLVSPGCIISGGRVSRSVLSPDVYVHRGAEVHEAIVMDGVDIGRGARLVRTIVDEGVRIPQGFESGVDRAADEKRFVVTEGGVTIIPQGIFL